MYLANIPTCTAYYTLINTSGTYFQRHLGAPAFIWYPALNQENTLFSPTVDLQYTVSKLGVDQKFMEIKYFMHTCSLS